MSSFPVDFCQLKSFEFEKLIVISRNRLTRRNASGLSGLDLNFDSVFTGPDNVGQTPDGFLNPGPPLAHVMSYGLCFKNK